MILARTDQVCVAALGVGAYPNGLAFRLVIKFRRSQERSERLARLFAPGNLPRSDPGQAVDELFRFGVRYADGRVGTDLEGDDSPDGAMALDESKVRITPSSGGGGGRSWEQGLFISRLCPMARCRSPLNGVATGSPRLPSPRT